MEWLLFRHTNQNTGSIWCCDMIQLRGPVGLNEINILLNSHAVKFAGEEVVIMDIYDWSHEATSKRQELPRVGRS